MKGVEDVDVFKLAHQLTLKIYSVTKRPRLFSDPTTDTSHGFSPNHEHVSSPHHDPLNHWNL